MTPLLKRRTKWCGMSTCAFVCRKSPSLSPNELESRRSLRTAIVEMQEVVTALNHPNPSTQEFLKRTHATRREQNCAAFVSICPEAIWDTPRGLRIHPKASSSLPPATRSCMEEQLHKHMTKETVALIPDL